MLRKLFFLVSLVFLMSLVGSALAFDPVRHKIDDFESWIDSDSMTWDKTIVIVQPHKGQKTFDKQIIAEKEREYLI